jgi:hypothetical protein
MGRSRDPRPRLVVLSDSVLSSELDDLLRNQGKVKSVEVTKVFSSGHAPCLMQLTYHDPKTAPRKIMLKDDDVRSDMMVKLLS